MEKLQQFAIGQRWLSDTETELGLGVLIDVDERSVSILFPKSDETRVYARNNAPSGRLNHMKTVMVWCVITLFVA